MKDLRPCFKGDSQTSHLYSVQDEMTTMFKKNGYVAINLNGIEMLYIEKEIYNEYHKEALGGKE